MIEICTELLQTSKATIEIKELGVDLSKAGGSNPTVFVRLLLLPIIAHLGEAQDIGDQLSSPGFTDHSHRYPTEMGRAVVPFLWEELFLSCELGHVRWVFFFSFPYFCFRPRNLGSSWAPRFSGRP